MNSKAAEDKITMHVLEGEMQIKIAEERRAKEETEKQKIRDSWIKRAQRYFVSRHDALQAKATKSKRAKHWDAVRVKNISTTGAVIIGETKYSKDDIINVNLGTEISNGFLEFRIKAVVVECKVNARGSGAYESRVKFDGEYDELFLLFLQKLGLREQSQNL